MGDRDHPEKNSKSNKEPRTYVSQMHHFLDENGLPPVGLPKEFYSSLDYHAAIVKAGSSHSSNTQFCSAITCRRRPNHKPCGSYLTVTHREDDVIHWQCPGCGEQGFISHWEGTIYDMTYAEEPEPGELVSITITPEEYKMLSEIIVVAQEESAIIFGAVSTPKGMLLTGRVEGFDQLLDAIAFDINHADSPKRRRVMDGIYDKIESVVEG